MHKRVNEWMNECTYLNEQYIFFHLGQECWVWLTCHCYASSLTDSWSWPDQLTVLLCLSRFAACCTSWHPISCMIYSFKEWCASISRFWHKVSCTTFACIDRTSRYWCNRLHCVILQALSPQPMATIMSAIRAAEVANWCTQAWLRDRHSNSCYGKEHHKHEAGAHIRV